MNEPFMITKITDAKGNVLYLKKHTEPTTVFDAQTSEIITAMLQEAVNQGTGTRIRNTYGIRAELAGKTGTAQNYSDAWFIAYTPDLVMGTWVGARTPDVHFYSGYGAGSALALPVVGQILRGIENDDLLRSKYLTMFSFTDPDKLYMQCNPFQQKGIKGFFNRLFSGKESKDAETQNKDKKEKSFLKRLFNRN
jgi:penicillin-binding protein 1A